MRLYVILVLASLFASLGVAELPQTATLDEVLALATRPEQPTKENGYDVERFNAIQRLQDWPQVAAKDEARIAAAFYASLSATNGNIRNGGAWGLGRRGNGEAITTIMELGEKDSNLIGCFFQLYTLDREIKAPIELLRRGLHSKNPDTRSATLQVIPWCKAVSLRNEVETVLTSDTSVAVRNDAAKTLSSLWLFESVPELRRVLSTGAHTDDVAYALTQLGGDEDIAVVLPLLKSSNENLRSIVAQGLSTARLINSRLACEALFEALRDPSKGVRFAAIQALCHFRDPRVIAPVKELILHPPFPISADDHQYFIEAISAIGGADAIALLDDMVPEFRSHFGLLRALVRFGSPSSARAVWAAYLKDPIRDLPDGDVSSTGYYEGLDVLAACADAELLRQIQIRLSTTKDHSEKSALEQLVRRIQTRLNK